MKKLTQRFLRAGGGSIVALALVLAASGMTATRADAAAEKKFGDCEVTPHPKMHPIDLKEPGVVHWAVPLPTPGAILGDTPDTVHGGYLYCIAAEIANRAGADSIKVRNTTFDAIISGADSDFDYTVWDVIITPERQKVLDFTVPYRTFDAVVVTTKDSGVTAENLKDKRIGTLIGARQVPWLEQNLKPKQPLRAFNNNQDLISALVVGQIDAFVHDTDGGILFAAENQKQGLLPVGRLPIPFSVGAVLPKGSANTAKVSQIIEDMKADGSLDAIYKKWLYPRWKGFKAEDVPLWNVKN